MGQGRKKPVITEKIMFFSLDRSCHDNHFSSWCAGCVLKSLKAVRLHLSSLFPSVQPSTSQRSIIVSTAVEASRGMMLSTAV